MPAGTSTEWRVCLEIGWMARTTRLLALLQILRGKSRPVTASALADELEVSERTLYRDIADLSAQGAPIYGEAGIGYVLRPGLFLPPLMLTEDETEAIVLGRRHVDQRGDEVLAQAAGENRRRARAGSERSVAKSNCAAGAAWTRLSSQRDRSADISRRHQIAEEAAYRLHRCEGRPQQACRLADRPWLYERGPRAAGMVRATASLSDIPHRPDHGSGGNRGALQGASRTAYARLARADEPRRNGTLYS